jgi:gluconolactonase
MHSRWALSLLLALVSVSYAHVFPELNVPTGSVEIFDEEAYHLLHDDMRPVIRARNFDWTEGPLWIEDSGYLLFSDIPNNRVHKYEPGVGTTLYLEPSGATGMHESDTRQGSNGLLLDADGRLVLLQHGDRRIAIMDASLDAPKARFQTLAGRYDGKRFNSPNDAVLHSDGSLYFTDPPYGLANVLDDEYRELSYQGIYRLAPDGAVTLLDDSVSLPNGIGLSPDEKTLYVAVSDQSDPHWLAYDVKEDGSVTNKSVFYDASESIGNAGEHGLPDGMAVHSSGLIFATGPGGIWLFSPEGTPLARILTGRATANCTLSADERILLITADDALLSLALGAREK